jgi:uncharacterized protein with HEPN domain
MKANDRSAIDYPNDIRDASEKAARFVTGFTFEQFCDNDEKVYAVIRALEVIGEATKNVSAALRKRYPEVPWNDIAGMRDKLIHGYFGVNLKRLWDTVLIDLPPLQAVVTKMLVEISVYEANRQK